MGFNAERSLNSEGKRQPLGLYKQIHIPSNGSLSPFVYIEWTNGELAENFVAISRNTQLK